MKRVKNLTFTAGIALLSALLLSTGCQNKQSAAEGSLALSAAKGALPISDGTRSLSLFMGGIGSQVTSLDYADNLFTKRIVDETGIKLNITGVNSSDLSQRMNVMLSSGDYPDLIINDNLGINDMLYYANQGIFIALDEYDPLSYPNIKAAFDEYPAFNQRLRGSDGKLYALPAANDCLHCRFRMGRASYYMPFIRDNGLKAPETLDELHEYLLWIRDNDANKNGNRNDEIPAAFQRDDLKNVIATIAKAYFPFVYTNQYFGLALDNKTVTEQYRDDYFRETLRYLAALYKENLILPDSFTMNLEQLRVLGESATPVLAVGFTNSQGNMTIQGQERWIDTFILPTLSGPEGARYGSNADPWSILRNGMFITDKCKDPELAVALFDYLLNFDVMLDGYIGPKGQAWTDPDPSSLSLISGEPAYKLLITFSAAPINSSWGSWNPMVRNSKFRLGEQAVGADIAREWIESGDPSFKSRLIGNASYNEEQNYFFTVPGMAYEMPAEYFIPPVAMSDEDTSRTGDISGPLNTFKDQACVEFITGVRDINSDAAWNTYLGELDRLGSRELVSIIQKYIL
ncbi:MAG: extracellular solute-binding protein [Treponema sp.]|jgi:putative aldouronate transport system substrate-binding protein|nr:extracellular solute-binding protein [Treponema sp.]